MKLDQGYSILGLEPGDSLDKVKSAYRILAFQYHPDLHPDDPKSVRKFQQLNEAFVLLRRHLETEGPPSSQEDRGSAPPPSDHEAGFRDSRKRGFRLRKEEVLRDVLKDPFARKVFEDIYREVRRTRSRGSGTREKGRDRNQKINTGKRRSRIDLSQGLWKSIRDWFRKQMDDEQVIYLPRTKLLPGITVRVQVKHPWSGLAKNLELTIPSNYVTGRPIRLQGMGRRLGPWRGDLYIRLLANPSGA